MIVPDVNVLLYAEIAAFPEHAKAKRWWEKLLGGSEEVGLPLPALFGFVRITTNPRVFTPALDVDAALVVVEAWLAQPNVRVLAPGPRHLEIAYLTVLMQRNEGNITRSAAEAGLTRYHLRELLKRHGLKGGDLD